MARLLISALRLAEHEVRVVSQFRSYAKTPEQAKALSKRAEEEAERIRQEWRGQPTPDLFFCYHPYYKSPDWLGPNLCRELGIPYVTAEASYARKHEQDDWADNQRQVVESLRAAAVNIAFTQRDAVGLHQALPGVKVQRLNPFIDTAAFSGQRQNGDPARFVTVAMMRDGDKFESYRFLALALSHLKTEPWRLSVVGDGPQRSAVEKLFAPVSERIDWLGEQDADGVAAALSGASIYLWPGIGEAYGLAYLEAQAAGLPIIAFDTAGVPAVVENGLTGHLVAEGDVIAYARHLRALLADHDRTTRMGKAAREFVFSERSLGAAAQALGIILTEATESNP